MTDKELLKMSDPDLCGWVINNPLHSRNTHTLSLLLNSFPTLSAGKKKKAVAMFREAVVDGKRFKFHFGEAEGITDDVRDLDDDLKFWVS